MDKQPLSSQGLPFESVSSVTGSSSNRNVFYKQSAVTRKDLSAQIEDNLSRLFECLKLEYGRQILVSPKWKNFGSQTLQFSEKTRLNNAIWRCWHIQYQKNKKPLFCQFVSPLSAEREPPKKPLTVVLQGRYWRRKLDAIAREYKKWRIYYKNKNEGVDENYDRMRTYSTGSVDDEVSHGSPLTQVVNLMDLELTTDLVHSHHDTLFTTKTKKVPKPAVSEIVFQPSLDSLQPNLDEFTKHLESLVDSIVQSNDPIQLPSSYLLPRQQDTQGQVEMMDQTSEYKPAYSICNTSASLNTSQTQRQAFMNTTESFTQFPMDYTSQMEIQDYGTSPISQPLSHESIPLTQLEEEPENEIFTPGTLSSPVQIPHSASQSSLQTYQVSPNTSATQSRGLPYRHSSSNLQDYGTSPTRKARLPRNVSDNQLSMIDHSQFNLGLGLSQSQERKIPAKDQFPNLVAYLQATTSGPTETTASQAKRPRIPRNMSDSKLYNTSAGGLHPVHLHNNQNFATSAPQQTPLEQIQSQAAQQKVVAINATQTKTRTRRGKLPRNMSDSSLMYMNQQQMNTTTLTSMQRRKSLDPNRALSPPTSRQSAHPVFSSTLAEPHEVNEAMRQGSLSMNTSSMMGTESLEQGVSLMDQLAQISSPSLPQSSQQKLNQSSVLSQLLNQGESGSLVQKDKEHSNHAIKQMFNMLQKTETPPKSSQDTSVNQLSSHLMSFLQNSGDQERNLMTPDSIAPVLTTPSQQQLPLQSQQVELQPVSLQPQQLQQQLLPQPHQQQQLISQNQQQQQLQKHLLPQTQQQQQFLPPLPQQQQQFLQTQQQQQHLSPPPHHQQQQHLTPPPHQQQQLQHQQQSLSQQQQQQLLTQQQQQQQQQHQLFGQQQQTQQLSLQAQQQHQLSGNSQENQLPPQISLQPVQQEIQKQQQVMQQFKEKGQTYPLEHQLQQLIHQQQQLKQQLQENQHSSQLISALQATNNALQEHLAESQQYQLIKPEQQQAQLSHQQGVMFKDNQEPKTTTINIQPKPVNTQSVPATILIAPQPPSSQTGVQQQHVNLAPVPTNLVSLQHILQGTSVSQGQATYNLGSAVVSLAATSSQQATVINSTVDSFSQALFSTCTSVAFSTSNAVINTSVSTTSIDTSSSIAGPLASANTLKFTRPVQSSDRQHYREHRRQSHISAEQKRRFNIKVGFDQLISLVPALACQKNAKVSKAMILHKSYDYITKLQRERDKVLEEQEILRKESQQLFASISQCQQKLPAFGVPLNRQRNDQMMAFYNQHVKSRTQENYKFWVLSVMFRQMFDSYNQKVTGNTWEEFCTSILSWMDEQCTLPTLRPAVLSALRDISRTTSILTDPSRVPQEIQRHVTAHEDPTNLSEQAQPAGSAMARNYFENTS